MRAIPSGYSTTRVYRVQRDNLDLGVSWLLKPADRMSPFLKQYDNGSSREWLYSYPDAGTPRDFHFIGALHAEEIVGLLTWRDIDWNDTLWLVDIRVRQDWRRAGIGSHLIRELKGICSQAGHRGIHVETQSSNFPAVSFYLKHGFSLAGLNDHLYTNHDVEDGEIALFLFRESESVY